MSKQKYVWQTYKERRKVYPYEETTAYYFGPKLDFTKEIKDFLIDRFPDIKGPKKDDICYATQNRQDAIKLNKS